MENAFGRVVSVIVLVIAVFIVPLNINYAKADYIRTIAITTKTTELVDVVRNIGYIDRSVYDNYKKSLSQLDVVYEIDMEHKKYAEYDNEDVWITYFTADIESEIYSSGAYDFAVGDYFKIIVYDCNSGEVLAYYGGTVRNERS